MGSVASISASDDEATTNGVNGGFDSGLRENVASVSESSSPGNVMITCQTHIGMELSQYSREIENRIMESQEDEEMS